MSIMGGPEIPGNMRESFWSLYSEEVSGKQGVLVEVPFVLHFGQILELSVVGVSIYDGLNYK